MNRGRIEICGGIAAGKTTLAKLLSSQGFHAVYERYQDNPFLGEFYQMNGEDCSFETEVVFTLLHYKMIKSRIDQQRLVCDYSLLQDFAYGKGNLKKADFDMYGQMYSYLKSQIGEPRMTIYLKCDIEVLAQRIRARGREMEQAIEMEYLAGSIVSLESCLLGNRNLLVIESDIIDFADQDRIDTVEKIKDFYDTGIGSAMKENR